MRRGRSGRNGAVRGENEKEWGRKDGAWNRKVKIKSPKKTGNVEGDAESRKKEERGETKKGMNKLVVVVGGAQDK